MRTASLPLELTPIAGSTATPAHKPCNCEKSRCLKYYCECFSRNTVCTNLCKCQDCQNNHSHQPPKRDQDKKPLDKASGQKRGCTCKNTSCMKKYCECYQKREFCSALCKCLDCKNNVIMMSGDNALRAQPPKTLEAELSQELTPKRFLTSRFFRRLRPQPPRPEPTQVRGSRRRVD